MINPTHKNKYTRFQFHAQSGYAILFAVVIVGIISLLSLGLSNTTYKQLVLSSLASDSQMSYFQSDTATECALYADVVLSMTSGSFSPWNCGINSTGTGTYSFTISPFGTGGYKATNTAASSLPCFEFDVDKAAGTTIYARGYNSCDKTGPKTVEREIQVTY